MSVMVHSFQACELGEWNEQMAVVNDAGVVTIYPQGVGAGPSMSMTVQEWIALTNHVTPVVQAWVEHQIAGLSKP